jgi:hypothetical protein
MPGEGQAAGYAFSGQRESVASVGQTRGVKRFRLCAAALFPKMAPWPGLVANPKNRWLFYLWSELPHWRDLSGFGLLTHFKT